jgi:hypothetical protein
MSKGGYSPSRLLTNYSVAYEEDTVICQANSYKEGQLV